MYGPSWPNQDCFNYGLGRSKSPLPFRRFTDVFADHTTEPSYFMNPDYSEDHFYPRAPHQNRIGEIQEVNMQKRHFSNTLLFRLSYYVPPPKERKPRFKMNKKGKGKRESHRGRAAKRAAARLPMAILPRTVSLERLTTRIVLNLYSRELMPTIQETISISSTS